MFKKLDAVLEEKVRPMLAQHGGGCELVDVDNYVAYIKLVGGCQGCASAKMTMTEGIERIIKSSFPEIQEVVDITEHVETDDTYLKA